MTSLDNVPLTGLDHYGLDNQQWRLQRVSITNWGGFDGGPHVLDVGSDATLIVGATGAGKSSILDAWVAVLQPPRSGALNTASNDAGGRTVDTYLHGQYDQTVTGEVVTPVELRPGPQLGMIALEFSSSSGAWCTVGRLLRCDGTPKGLDSRWLIARSRIPATFSLGLFARQFSQARLADVWPGLQLFQHWPKFAEEAMPLLGIGRGNFRQPLALLRDIQAGKSLSSVTDLFRGSVLDVPSTYARADTALSEFGQIVDVHRRFAEDARKLAQLRPLRDRLVEFRAAQHTSDQLGGYVTTAVEDSEMGDKVFQLWAATRQVDYLDAQEDQLASAMLVHQTRRDTLEDQTASLAREIEKLRALWLDQGGERMADLQAELDDALRRTHRIQAKRVELEHGHLKVVSPLPTMASEWHALVERLDHDTSAERKHHLTETADETRVTSRAAEQRVAHIGRQIEDCIQAGNNIPPELCKVRDQFAAVAGLPTSDVPFIGELLDMAPGQESWRVAANAVGGSFAREVLVPEQHLAAFSMAIDHVVSGHRLRYRGVPQDLPVDAGDGLDPATLASKLMVDPGSRFAGWLSQQLPTVFRAVCVDDAADLADDAVPRVTKAGQERRGTRGAHGGGHVNVLGFSNESTLERLRADLAEAEDHRVRAQQAAHRAAQQMSDFRTLEVAAVVAKTQDWSDLDLRTATTRRDELDRELEALRASEDQLAELSQQITTKSRRRDELVREQGKVGHDLEQATGDYEACSRHKSRVLDRQQELLTRGDIDLTDEQQTFLDDRLDQIADTRDSFEQLKQQIAQVKRGLQQDLAAAHSSQQSAQRGAEQLMHVFLDSWPDYRHELQATIEASDQFMDLLHELEDAGLEDQRRTWAENVQTWTSSHLSNLLQEFDTAGHTIIERLAPVRRLLGAIAYGSNGDRLDVHVRHNPPEVAKRFRRDLVSALNDLLPTSYSPDEDLVDEVEQRITHLEDVLARIQSDAPSRDQILDVRLHHEFSARSLHPVTGEPIAYYSSAAGKSGGESQELLAFITGAALRCRLGDEDNNRPTFAPVVLDEAFIKADSQTAPRALAALSSLGFQPIVVAPEGVFTALEPLFRRTTAIVKNDDRSHIYDYSELTDEQRRQVHATTDEPRA